MGGFSTSFKIFDGDNSTLEDTVQKDGSDRPNMSLSNINRPISSTKNAEIWNIKSKKNSNYYAMI